MVSANWTDYRLFLKIRYRRPTRTKPLRKTRYSEYNIVAWQALNKSDMISTWSKKSPTLVAASHRLLCPRYQRSSILNFLDKYQPPTWTRSSIGLANPSYHGTTPMWHCSICFDWISLDDKNYLLMLADARICLTPCIRLETVGVALVSMDWALLSYCPRVTSRYGIFTTYQWTDQVEFYLLGVFRNNSRPSQASSARLWTQWPKPWNRNRCIQQAWRRQRGLHPSERIAGRQPPHEG